MNPSLLKPNKIILIELIPMFISIFISSEPRLFMLNASSQPQKAHHIIKKKIKNYNLIRNQTLCYNISVEILLYYQNNTEEPQPFSQNTREIAFDICLDSVYSKRAGCSLTKQTASEWFTNNIPVYRQILHPLLIQNPHRSAG